MKFIQNLYLHWKGDAFPQDILTQFYLNSVTLFFEQNNYPAANRTEPTVEELVNLCAINCTNVFSMRSISADSVGFYFYNPSDLKDFITHIQTIAVKI